jgi:hypothetical protein
MLTLCGDTVLDARRGIVAELRNRRTYWGRLLADLQLPAKSRGDLEAAYWPLLNCRRPSLSAVERLALRRFWRWL